MRGQRTALGAALLTAMFVLAAPAEAQSGTLTGRVTNAETGAPIDAAQISVLGTATGGLTDAAGRYPLQLPSGSYSLVVQVVGFVTTRFEGISVLAGETTTYDMALESQAYALNPIQVTVGRL